MKFTDARDAKRRIFSFTCLWSGKKFQTFWKNNLAMSVKYTYYCIKVYIYIYVLKCIYIHICVCVLPPNQNSPGKMLLFPSNGTSSFGKIPDSNAFTEVSQVL